MCGRVQMSCNLTHRMLDDLGDRVDATDNRLKRASRKMQDFIRRNEGQLISHDPPLMRGRAGQVEMIGHCTDNSETKSGYCICILIIVLIILLVLVILT